MVLKGQEPNMHPSSHPDVIFANSLKDPNSNEPLRESMDRKRGYVPTSAKSASIHTLSPSNPSPRSASYSGNHTPDLLHHSSLGNSNSNPNSLFTASPLQNHVGIDYSNPGSMPVPIAGVSMADMSKGMFDAGNINGNGIYASNSNFNFTSGQGHSHEQPLQNVWGLNTGPNQPPPTVQPQMGQVSEFAFANPDPGAMGDIGFDWNSWMSTANVSMGPIPMDELEQYGIH
jgi:hypothetical protein